MSRGTSLSTSSNASCAGVHVDCHLALRRGKASRKRNAEQAPDEAAAQHKRGRGASQTQNAAAQEEVHMEGSFAAAAAQEELIVEGSTAPAVGANPAANAGPVDASEASKGSQQVCTSDCVACTRGLYHRLWSAPPRHFFDSHNPAGAIGQGGSCNHAASASWGVQDRPGQLICGGSQPSRHFSDMQRSSTANTGSCCCTGRQCWSPSKRCSCCRPGSQDEQEPPGGT